MSFPSIVSLHRTEQAVREYLFLTEYQRKTTHRLILRTSLIYLSTAAPYSPTSQIDVLRHTNNREIVEENKCLSTLSDGIAIEQCRRGEIRGLETLAQHYQVTSLRLAFLLTDDIDAAQDIVQESFIRAYQRIHQFHVGQPFGPWFHRIVINMAHQYRRSPSQNRVDVWKADEDARLVSDPLTLPEVSAEQHEMREAMDSAINALPEKQREVIILRYYLNYTDQEIANILHCNHAAVRQRLHAGRNTLQKIIRQHYPWLVNVDQHFADTSASYIGEV